MYNLLTKYGLPIFFGIGALLLIIYFLLVNSSINSTGQPDSGVLFGIVVTILLLVIALLATLGFMIYQLINNPKSAISFFIGIAALVASFFIGMLLVGDDSLKVTNLIDDFKISKGANILIDGMIGSGVLLTVIAVVSVIALEVYANFKK